MVVAEIPKWLLEPRIQIMEAILVIGWLPFVQPIRLESDTGSGWTQER